MFLRKSLTTRKLLVFATKGSGTNEEQRICALVGRHSNDVFPFDRSRKLASFFRLLGCLRVRRRSLIVMEGTGIAGGLACLIARLLWRHQFVVSSGDAIGPYVWSQSLVAGPAFSVYERVLCRCAAGFIGWTPYLVGRALTFGAPRAITAPGWPLGSEATTSSESSPRFRTSWGVPSDAIVFGLVGSIMWNRRRRYCYGLELVQAIQRVSRGDVVVVIVGDGTGLDVLRSLAGNELGKRVFLPGPVPLGEVRDVITCFDIGSLPQSMDGVGSFRFTTKVSEYASCRLPFLTSQIPAGYDLDVGQIVRLPGRYPWDATYIDALADFMSGVSRDALDRLREAYDSRALIQFCKAGQVARVGQFLSDILADHC